MLTAPVSVSTPVAITSPAPVLLAPALPAAPLAPDAMPKLPLPGPGDPGKTRLGDPPAPGSLVHRAELKAMHAIQDRRTPEGDAWANRMSAKGGLPIWIDTLGRYKREHGLLQAAAGAALLGTALASTSVATLLAKRHYDRDRPYVTDPTLTPVVPLPHDQSYPSGHASAAFAAARVFSALDPSMTKDAYASAAQIAASRVYGGVHYPSDVVAGAALGTGIAQAILNLVPGRRR